MHFTPRSKVIQFTFGKVKKSVQLIIRLYAERQRNTFEIEFSSASREFIKHKMGERYNLATMSVFYVVIFAFNFH